MKQSANREAATATCRPCFGACSALLLPSQRRLHCFTFYLKTNSKQSKKSSHSVCCSSHLLKHPAPLLPPSRLQGRPGLPLAREREDGNAQVGVPLPHLERLGFFVEHERDVDERNGTLLLAPGRLGRLESPGGRRRGIAAADLASGAGRERPLVARCPREGVACTGEGEGAAC